VIPGVEEFVAEFTSEDTWGADGYLAEAIAASAKAMAPMAF